MIGRLAIALALVAGCVPAVAPREAPVRRVLVDRGGGSGALSADELTAALGHLDRAAAVRIALARQPRVEAALAALGVTVGDVAALRDVTALHADVAVRFHAAHAPAVELDVVHDLLGLALARPRRAAAAAITEAAQARAIATVLAVADRAERAYLAAAAAAERVGLARTAFDTTAAAADLAGRMQAAGGTTDLALARAQAEREDARLMLARAELDVELARAEVDAALGLTGAETRWSLAGELPALPAAPPALDDLEAAAIAASLALRALAADQRAAANQARVADVRAWLPDLGVGVSVASEPGAGTAIGPALRIGLPLTTAGRGRARAARADVRRVDGEQAAVAIELRARARALRLEALATYDQARHLRDVIIPLRRRVLDELVLQYNAMNASPFELLVARRELATRELDLVDARHRFAAAMVAVAGLRQGATAEPGASSTWSAGPPPAAADAGH